MGRGSVRVALAALILAAPILAAQDKSKDTKAGSVPESAMPPAGMCRLWLPDVPERQQAAPTDCATAIRTMPRDAMVLFGDLKRAAKQTTLSPAAEAAARRQSAMRDAPQFRGSNRAERAREQDSRAGTGGQGAQRTQGTAIVRGGSATQAAGTAAATKAPDTKAAVIVKPPENPQ